MCGCLLALFSISILLVTLHSCNAVYISPFPRLFLCQSLSLAVAKLRRPRANRLLLFLLVLFSIQKRDFLFFSSRRRFSSLPITLKNKTELKLSKIPTASPLHHTGDPLLSCICELLVCTQRVVGPFTCLIAFPMRSAALGDSSSPSSGASSTGCGPAKPRRHVGFSLDRTLEDEEKESEKTSASRAPVRRGMQATMTAGEHLAWSARVAESDALRQRALQCGEDIARVASGLGYEVVTHTPTAFLKRSSASAAASAAVAKPETEPQRFSAADGASARLVETAASLSLPSAAAPFHTPPVFLNENGSCSCSSRSSSLGTEEQVGLVPVLSPLLHAAEVARHPLSDGAAPRIYEVQLPRALASTGGANRFAAGEIPAPGSQTAGPRRVSVAEMRPATFGPLRENSPTSRSANTANLVPPTSASSLSVRSASSAAQSPSNATPSPRQSLTPRRAVLARHHGSLEAVVAGNQSHSHRRTTASNGVSGRAAGNANTSVGVEYLNGPVLPAMRPAQSSNHPLTPATEVLNTPALRLVDDDIWPRLQGRPIQ